MLLVRRLDLRQPNLRIIGDFIFSGPGSTRSTSAKMTGIVSGNASAAAMNLLNEKDRSLQFCSL